MKPLMMYRKIASANPLSDFVKYKLYMYDYYKQHIEDKVDTYTRQMKNFQTNQYYYTFDNGNNWKPPVWNCDAFYYTDYSHYLEHHVVRYRFLKNIKEYLKIGYEDRLETFYKTVYSPSNVAKLLDDGYEIEDAFLVLEEDTKYVAP